MGEQKLPRSECEIGGAEKVSSRGCGVANMERTFVSRPWDCARVLVRGSEPLDHPASRSQAMQAVHEVTRRGRAAADCGDGTRDGTEGAQDHQSSAPGGPRIYYVS